METDTIQRFLTPRWVWDYHTRMKDKVAAKAWVTKAAQELGIDNSKLREFELVVKSQNKRSWKIATYDLRIQRELMALFDRLTVVRVSDVLANVKNKHNETMSPSNVRYNMRKLVKAGLAYKAQEPCPDVPGEGVRDIWARDPDDLARVLKAKR